LRKVYHINGKVRPGHHFQADRYGPRERMARQWFKRWWSQATPFERFFRLWWWGMCGLMGLAAGMVTVAFLGAAFVAFS